MPITDDYNALLGIRETVQRYKAGDMSSSEALIHIEAVLKEVGLDV